MIADDLEGASLQLPDGGRADISNSTNVLVTPASERSAPRIHFAEDEDDEDDLDIDYLKSKLWCVAISSLK